MSERLDCRCPACHQETLSGSAGNDGIKRAHWLLERAAETWPDWDPDGAILIRGLIRTLGEEHAA